MAVHYITVTPVTKLFKPATRAFGDIAIVGTADADTLGPIGVPVAITNPDNLGVVPKTTLTAAASAADTTLTVEALAGTPAVLPFNVKIDDEVVTVTAIPDSTTLTVTRGAAASVAAAHANGTSVLFGPKDRSVDDPGNAAMVAKTRLTAAATATDTTLTVEALAETPPVLPFDAKIDDEVVTVTAIPDSTTLTVTRGTAASVAADHANGTSVLVGRGDIKENIPPSWFKGNLGAAVRKAFVQTPGPTTVWALRTATATTADLTNALKEVAKLDVQIVVLANTPLGRADSPTTGRTEIELLSSHVNTVSKTGGDGKERIGVAMLGSDVTDPTTVITGNMSNERMVLTAHKSGEDAAAAVAGTIAGYEPHISLLLKPVSLSMDTLFSDSEIEAFDKARVNWLTDPTLIPGKGLFMGEGYTLGAEIPYIDIIRTIDDVSFRLKAQLIRSIGDLRVSRSGLRTLVSQMTAILEPLKQREVIEGYDVFLPLLVLLDKDPASLSAAELQQINDAQNARTVDAIVSVDYAGAIHRLNITLKFE